MEEYRFDPSGTTITDHGNGKITFELHLIKNPDIFLEEAAWFRKIMLRICSKVTKPLQVLSDMTKYDTSLLSQLERDTHRDLIEQVGGFEKLAIIGDMMLYSTIIGTLSTLSDENARKIKFFFNHKDALNWLGW